MITYSYQITLKNYSDNDVKFNMQVQKTSIDDSLAISDVSTINAQGNQTLRVFTLYPREKKQLIFEMYNRDDEHSAINGSMYRPNITPYCNLSRLSDSQYNGFRQVFNVKRY